MTSRSARRTHSDMAPSLMSLRMTNTGEIRATVRLNELTTVVWSSTDGWDTHIDIDDEVTEEVEMRAKEVRLGEL